MFLFLFFFICSLDLIPALYEQYPNQALDIVVASNTPPNAVFSVEGISFDAVPATINHHPHTKFLLFIIIYYDDDDDRG